MLRLTAFASLIALSWALGSHEPMKSNSSNMPLRAPGSMKSNSSNIPLLTPGSMKANAVNTTFMNKRPSINNWWFMANDILFTKSCNIKRDPCTEWYNYNCEDYSRNAAPEYFFRGHNNVITLVTQVWRDHFHSLQGPPGHPHGPDGNREYARKPGEDKHTWERMREFYDHCYFRTRSRALELGPLRLFTDQIHEMYVDDNRNAVEAVTNLLSSYQVWAFASFEPHRSPWNNSNMRVVVKPHPPQGMPAPIMYTDEKWLVWYKKIISEYLKDNYKKWEAPDHVALAQAVIDLEKKIHAIAPKIQEWEMLSKNLHVMSLDELDALAPKLALKKVIMRQPGVFENPIEEVEVMFPDYLRKISAIVGDQVDDTLRAFFTWQVFVKTNFPVEGLIADQYEKFRAVWNGHGKGIPHDERCRTRTMEFFRHYVAATWIGHTVNATVSLDAYSDVEKIFETIRLEFRHHIQATPWMDNQTRQNALDKIDTMSIELGYSTDSPDLRDQRSLAKYYEGLHMDKMRYDTRDPPYYWDELRIRNWQVRKKWEFELLNPPPDRAWSIDPWTLHAFYSFVENRLYVPLSLLIQNQSGGPWFSLNMMPLNGIYSRLGVYMAREIARAFSPVGMQYNAKGELDPVIVTAAAQKGYDARVDCFRKKYDGMRSQPNKNGVGYHLKAERVLDRAISDTIGEDMAYKAWKKTQIGQIPDHSPQALSVYSNTQLYWIYRTLMMCIRQTEGYHRFEVYNPDGRLPQKIRTGEVPKDLKGFNEAWSCKPKEKFCSILGKEVDITNLKLEKDHMPLYMTNDKKWLKKAHRKFKKMIRQGNTWITTKAMERKERILSHTYPVRTTESSRELGSFPGFKGEVKDFYGEP